MDKIQMTSNRIFNNILLILSFLFMQFNLLIYGYDSNSYNLITSNYVVLNTSNEYDNCSKNANESIKIVSSDSSSEINSSVDNNTYCETYKNNNTIVSKVNTQSEQNITVVDNKSENNISNDQVTLPIKTIPNNAELANNSTSHYLENKVTSVDKGKNKVTGYQWPDSSINDVSENIENISENTQNITKDTSCSTITYSEAQNNKRDREDYDEMIDATSQLIRKKQRGGKPTIEDKEYLIELREAHLEMFTPWNRPLTSSLVGVLNKLKKERKDIPPGVCPTYDKTLDDWVPKYADHEELKKIGTTNHDFDSEESDYEECETSDSPEEKSEDDESNDKPGGSSSSGSAGPTSGSSIGESSNNVSKMICDDDVTNNINYANYSLKENITEHLIKWVYDIVDIISQYL